MPEDYYPLTSSAPERASLTAEDIAEFKNIMREDCGVELSDQEAWSRVIELIALVRMICGPLPEDPEARTADRPAWSPEVAPPGGSAPERGLPRGQLPLGI